MKKLLIALGVIIVLLIAAVLIIPSFIPIDTYKDEIANQVRERTGREFAINGEVSVSLLPNVALEVNDVTFGNAKGARTSEMASLKQLQIDVKLFPLISGELDINRFILIDPVINLEVLPDGTPNWQIVPPSAAGADSSGGAGAPGLDQIRLGDVRLENGQVSYFDAKTGTEQVLSDVNVTVELDNINAPFSVDGSMVWQGEKIDITLNADSLNSIMQGGSTNAKLAVAAAPVKLDYQGTITAGDQAGAAGDVSLNVPSVRKLMGWVGNPMPEGSGFGLLDIKGKMAASAAKASFSDASIAFDEIKGTGQLAIDASGAVPSIEGRLDLEELDLNPYMPPSSGDEAAASDSSGAAADWSDEPLDFSALKAFNANFTLTAKGIKAQNITIGKSALTLTNAGGKMTGDLTELALYGGQGQGKFVLDASGDVPAVHKVFAMSGIQAEPLLSDAMGNDSLSGSGNLSFALDANGISQRQMVKNLDGNGAFDFRDGAIKGFNLGAMVRNVTSAFLDAGAQEEQKTDFSELSATFVIVNGMLTNDDLNMSSPLFRVDGAGTADLPARTVNYKVTPKLVASTEGQGGATDLKGVAVPVIISGPWSDLSYTPDILGAIGDPEELAKGALGALGGSLEGGAGLEGVLEGGAGAVGGDVVKGLLGGDGEGTGATPEAGDVVKGLLGGEGEATEGAAPSAGDVVKGLLGGGTTEAPAPAAATPETATTAPATATPEAATTEGSGAAPAPNVVDDTSKVIKGLFGGD
ncbi:MAG: AsmA family protein [Alphaproteobacteria bacterium]|nr:AsmA family protein [Alphaproteobacteria bacterium]